MRRAQGGVSLVEMLIVIGIIGLTGSLVVLVAPLGRDDARPRSGQIIAALDRAARISIVSGAPVALASGPKGQRFESYTGGAWRVIPDMPSRRDDTIYLMDGARGADGVSRLIFTPDGRSSGGRIALPGGAEITVARDTRVSVSERD